ncbi:hypothetical protein [Nocardia sputorum]|uniref:ESX-1 secretion-associated protein EspA/EspE-like domain-containing protein n=1 Tax=Nocardia sputorum TaxID=2984338 RepID=A0ABN6U228_9NOCA|nr:hypothetical protein [Nocardia sputorum]BDT99261.1 hypothetical protein IFM12276_22900 [Nocardia sputorum]
MTAEHLAAPLSPSVLDALHNTPVAPLLDQSAQQVLAGIGLPALPQLSALPPLPGLPALPPLDPTALIRPVTDLFSGFGSGDLATDAGLNPQTVLQRVTDAVGTVIQLASSGIQLLQSMESSGVTAATSAALDTVATSASISEQATRINLVTGGAAATVATGYAEMAALATRFALTTAALGPTLVTPPGQAALLATAIEAGTEATAITARTKAQLLGQSAEMAEAGEPVPTRVPKRADPGKVQRSLARSASTVSGSVPETSMITRGSATATTGGAGSAGSAGTSRQSSLTQLLSQVQQLVTPLISLGQTVGKEAAAQLSAKPVAETSTPAANRPTSVSGLSAASVPGTVAAVTPAATVLGGWQAEGIVTAAPTSQVAAVGIPITTSTYSHEMLPPLVPGAALTDGDGRARPSGSAPAQLADTRYVDELIGSGQQDIAAPVIGLDSTDDPDTPFSL